MDENETLNKKIKLYFEKGTPVHISINNFKFYNGIILGLQADFLIIKDEVLGEMPVFFSEITNIEPRAPKR